MYFAHEVEYECVSYCVAMVVMLDTVSYTYTNQRTLSRHSHALQAKGDPERDELA